MGHDPEVAEETSGGGFSNYFPRPYYQVTAVPAFFQNIGDMHKGLFKFVHCRDRGRT